jgi:hypothetical protein
MKNSLKLNITCISILLNSIGYAIAQGNCNAAPAPGVNYTDCPNLL